MGEVSPPPYYLPNYWTDSPSKTAFDIPRFEPSENVAKFYLKVSDDVAGWVKGQIFDYLPLLASQGKAHVAN